MSGKAPLVGVLSLQGSFSEHIEILRKCGAETKEIRVPKDLEGIEGIVFPGGESTAMAIVGEPTGIFPALRALIGRWARNTP